MTPLCNICGRFMVLQWNAGQLVWTCIIPHYSIITTNNTKGPQT